MNVTTGMGWKPWSFAIALGWVCIVLIPDRCLAVNASAAGIVVDGGVMIDLDSDSDAVSATAYAAVDVPSSAWGVGYALGEIAANNAFDKTVAATRGYRPNTTASFALGLANAQGTELVLEGPNGMTTFSLILPDAGEVLLPADLLPGSVPDNMRPLPQSLFSDAVPQGGNETDLNVFVEMDAMVQFDGVSRGVAGSVELQQGAGLVTETGALTGLFSVSSVPGRDVATANGGVVLDTFTISITNGQSSVITYHNEIDITGADMLGPGGDRLRADDPMPAMFPSHNFAPFSGDRGSGGAFSVWLVPNDNQYQFVVVPEPTAAGTLFAGLALLGLFRRRR